MLKAFGIRKEWVQVPKGVKPEVTTPAGIKRESVIPMTPKSSPLLAPSKRKAGKYSSDDDEDDNTDLFFLELSPRKKFKYVKIQEDSEMEIGE